MEEIGIPELTEDQMQTLSEVAEKAARDYVLSSVPQKRISSLNIVIEAEGSRPITIRIEIELKLAEPMKTIKTDDIVHEATEVALEAVEECLKDLSHQSKS